MNVKIPISISVSYKYHLNGEKIIVFWELSVICLLSVLKHMKASSYRVCSSFTIEAEHREVVFWGYFIIIITNRN